MKNLFLLLVILQFSVSAFAQFPAPTNFTLSIDYVEMGESSVCNQEPLSGPAHCSELKWNLPDTSQTNAKLKSFNIYIKYDNGNEDLFEIVTDTFFITDEGFEGTVWVTAVYENPYGESDPSNKVDGDLPIGISKKDNPKETISYNPASQSLIINASPQSTLSIYNVKGQLVKKFTQVDKTILISELQNGFYLMKLADSENNITTLKIVK